jgi:hypothetical protein
MRIPPTLASAIALASVPISLDGQADEEWSTDFSRHTVPLDEIVSGGPPKDGIPAIDDPRFVSVSEADRFLEDREPVVLLTIAGAVRAYPLQILIWHEIVNDTVNGTPVAVTYCPLCNTALAFDRRLDGRVLDFGTTGRLRHSDLVMYDRQTESWWQQATGEAIVGELAGRRLDFIPAPLISWKQFKRTYPEAPVLSRDTGYRRDYGRNPYVRYDDRGGSPWPSFFRRQTDGGLPAMERVVSVLVDGRAAAYSFEHLADVGVVNDRVADQPLAIFWAPGTASALDDGQIADGRDVGSTNVVLRRVGDRELIFEAVAPGRYRDKETGSEWDLLGRAVAGELRGTRLRAVPHGNHFWFAWVVFQPDTKLVR